MASFPDCESTWQLVYYNFIVFSLPGLICARPACLPLLPDPLRSSDAGNAHLDIKLGRERSFPRRNPVDRGGGREARAAPAALVYFRTAGYILFDRGEKTPERKGATGITRTLFFYAVKISLY